MLDLEGLRRAVTEGNRDAVQALVSAGLAAGVPAIDILNEGLLPAMEVVGKRFGAKEMFISEVLLTARAMHTGLALLKPSLGHADGAGGARPVVVLGTVRGDLHDIGKNLVAMMLEAGGFEVVDLGTNVSADKFVQAARQHRPAVIALSALLTTTMREMRQTLEVLRRAGVVDGVKMVVGGAPVTEEFAKTIGADGWAPDAPTAVTKIRALLA
ncbi:MAG: corrinoid protein [Candidatus Rokubacteria bacterium]|nr:corrinoid protein [Candidatus Rokubacteria bacterium]